MTAVVIVLIGLGVASVALAMVSRNHRMPGAHTMPKDRPHRPAPDSSPPAGARHRVDDAHTASFSATDVLRRLDREGLEAYEKLRRQEARR